MNNGWQIRKKENRLKVTEWWLGLDRLSHFNSALLVIEIQGRWITLIFWNRCHLSFSLLLNKLKFSYCFSLIVCNSIFLMQTPINKKNTDMVQYQLPSLSFFPPTKEEKDTIAYDSVEGWKQKFIRTWPSISICSPKSSNIQNFKERLHYEIGNWYTLLFLFT